MEGFCLIFYGNSIPLHDAAENNQKITSLKLLLMYKNEEFNINAQDEVVFLKIDGYTPLHEAVFSSNKKAVQLLLKEKDINVNIISKDGETPLMLAVICRHYDIVKILLNYPDTDLMIPDKEGKTIFEVATDESINNLIMCKYIHH